ncbi:MAG: RNA methyltransferase [Lachnospiraceae bacterium]|nr:RNA methyltransferase [Lachnospiraceae bacterium]
MTTKKEKLNLIPITDLAAPELSVYAHATEQELLHFNEPDPGIFIAETANVLIRALHAGYRIRSVLVEDRRFQTEALPVFETIEALYGAGELCSLPVYMAPHDVVSDLTGYNLVRGLWAVLERKPLPDVSTFCEDKNRIAVLTDVVNPTNVGAIIRSAAALGMEGVILTYPSVSPLTRRASRVSMGTVFQIPWTILPKDADPVSLLKENGFETAAMALRDNSIPPDDAALGQAEKLAVFLGTEGTGLPDEVIEACDHKVMIPMAHGVDSLNVAAASAVIFWELAKKPL